MLFSLSITDNKMDAEEVESINFGQIKCGGNNAKELHLEMLIAENVSLLQSASGDADSDTLLIIGRQVRTESGRSMDLVALDRSGAINLIEVKRDATDVAARKDHAEIQAVRYAAGLATLETADEIVQSLFAPYVEKYKPKEWIEASGGRTASEWAAKKFREFLAHNDITPDRLNHSQKVVLVGAGFDADTVSAAAWMAANGLPIRLIQATPRQLGDQYFLDINELLPLASYSDFYVNVTERQSAMGKGAGPSSKGSRASRLRLSDLIAAKKVAIGDQISFKLDDTKTATLLNGLFCEVNGAKQRINQWACDVSGWSAVNIYEWVVHVPSSKTLEDIRTALETEQESDDAPSETPAETASELEVGEQPGSAEIESINTSAVPVSPTSSNNVS